MIEYKIKEQAPDAVDIKIVKTGGEVEFTLGAIDRDVIYLQKALKEAEGKIGIEKATLENIKNSHPHIALMSQEDLTAAYLYRQSTGFLAVAEPKVEEIKKQLADYAEEKVEILKQTGIVLSEEVK